MTHPVTVKIDIASDDFKISTRRFSIVVSLDELTEVTDLAAEFALENFARALELPEE